VNNLFTVNWSLRKAHQEMK